MRTRALLAALPLALAACGGHIFFAEMEVPSLCVTLPRYAFPGTNADPSLSRQISYQLGAQLPVLNQPNVEYELRLSQLDTTLESSNPATDPGYTFSSIQWVRIVAYDPTGVLPDVELAYYRQDPANPATTVMIAGGAMDVDLAPYLQAGQLNFRADYSGGLPLGDFTADVRGCFYLKVVLDYGKFLPL